MNKNRKSNAQQQVNLQLIMLLLMGVAVVLGIKLVKSNADNRNLATSSATCKEQCPGKDGVLRNCTPPEVDGSSNESMCNAVNRIEPCGGKCFICPAKGGKWKATDNSKCLPIGKDLILNYKVAFGGVNPNSSQCAINWPLQITVVGEGESKTYANVIPTTKTTVGDKLVFSGSLTLTGFTKKTGVSVFIKGPKHLKTKYCKNNQTSTCNQVAGEITLTDVATTSPIYDFSGNPLLPGDVVAVSSETAQDGWINGVDFSYVKSKSLVHETVATGENLRGDLDGNCQVNSNDVNLLKISLQDKQEQLY